MTGDSPFGDPPAGPRFQFGLKRLMLVMFLFCVLAGVLSWAWREGQVKIFVILVVAAPMGMMVIMSLVRSFVQWLEEDRGPK